MTLAAETQTDDPLTVNFLTDNPFAVLTVTPLKLTLLTGGSFAATAMIDDPLAVD